MPADIIHTLLDEAKLSHTSAICVMQGDQVLLDEVLDGRGERPIETMSVTKAVISLLVGRAVTLGHIPSVDMPVADVYPQWRQGRKKDITLRHLMTHTSGLQNLPAAPVEIYPSPDFVELALCAELDTEPGKHFEYNNKAVNLICGLLERTTGCKADEFAQAELFRPLGIERWYWVRDRRGNPHGMSGLGLLARDLARLGQLAINGGELIQADYLRESTQPATPVFPQIGLLWWMWHPQAEYEITEEHVQNLEAAGGTEQQVAALRSLQGNHTRPALHQLMQLHQFNPMEVPTGTKWVNENLGLRDGVIHDGWLGQYLMVHEPTATVGVRLIEWNHPRANAPESGFDTFPIHILKLAQALKPET